MSDDIEKSGGPNNPALPTSTPQLATLPEAIRQPESEQKKGVPKPAVARGF